MIVGVGVDLVEHERVESSLEKFGDRFKSKIFTEDERAYAEKRARPSMHYAARFAAKEAFLKAVGLGLTSGMRWRDAGVLNDELGKPELVVKGTALDRAWELGATHAHVTLSHSRGHAIAVVVLERRDEGAPQGGLGRPLGT